MKKREIYKNAPFPEVVSGARTVLYRIWIVIVLAAAWAGSAFGLEHVTLRYQKQEAEISGRLLVEAQDGGFLVQTRDGTIWTVQPEDLVKRASDGVAFEPLSAEDLSRQLLTELPHGFAVYRTAHYLICHNTSHEYAHWCGSLFERLYTAFTNDWTHKGFQLSEPEFPLVAIVFSDKQAYREHARTEVGEMAESIIGFFSLRTNRMTMCDLTGIEAVGRSRPRNRSAALKQMLARSDAERTVATIVHEATHQIAFNCGLNARYSDCPMWFSEGMAVYFETPDLSSSKGWTTIGRVNRVRLPQFQSYLRRRPPDSLTTLLTDDKRIRDAQTAENAYAEAWALTYYLLHKHADQYVDYLKTLSRKKPMVWDSPDTRLAEFKAAFGDDLKKLDADFVRFMNRSVR